MVINLLVTLLQTIHSQQHPELLVCHSNVFERRLYGQHACCLVQFLFIFIVLYEWQAGCNIAFYHLYVFAPQRRHGFKRGK